MNQLCSFVPPASLKLLQCWINELDVKLIISKPRKTKLGDFRVVKNRFIISINNNLNKYSFLITLTHEIAHAFVYVKYKSRVLPHGKSWKLTFKSLMLNFINMECFPDDVLRCLSKHMINPKASTFSDYNLLKVLRLYNKVSDVILADISDGDMFKFNGKIFVKGATKRKRIQCVEKNTNKVYLFHPFAEIIQL